MPTSFQLAAARAALGLSVNALAERTRLGVNTIRRAEAAGAQVLTRANAEQWVGTLTALGITFLPDEEGQGPGLRIRPDLKV